MNLGELEKFVRQMKDEGHANDTDVMVAIPDENGNFQDARKPINLHYANGGIWIPVDCQQRGLKD